MNLRVDLILVTEQRSSSIINPRMLLRLACIAGPLLLAFVVLMQVSAYMRLRSDLNGKQADWKLLEPKEKAAVEQARAFQANSAVQKELSGWKKAHIDWHEQMIALLREVPRSIQLQTLSISEVLQLVNGKIPARSFSMLIKGKAVGADAEVSVQELNKRLMQSPGFQGVVADAEVQQFGADAAKDAGKQDRVFQILCHYREREFE